MITTWYQPTCVVEDIQLALLPAAGHAPETLELVPAERVQPLVPSRVLHEPRIGRMWSHDRDTSTFIGPDRSRDLDTGLWLDQIYHVTLILVSDWSRWITWPISWHFIGRTWSCRKTYSCSPSSCSGSGSGAPGSCSWRSDNLRWIWK